MHRQEHDDLHRLLDGDLPPDVASALLDRLDTDPLLKQDFDQMEKMVGFLGEFGRKSAPANFTADVMKNLPERPQARLRTLWDFVFRPRVLRWNMATAALAVAFVLSITVLLQFGKDRSAAPQIALQKSQTTVTFRLHAPDAQRVTLAGDFNAWSEEEGRMVRQEGGLWRIDIPLNPGTHHYMFVVDGRRWVTDPNAEAYRDDGFGNKNAIVRVSDL